jgi:hypothetical protein
MYVCVYASAFLFLNHVIMEIMGLHNSLCETKHNKLRDIVTCKESHAVDGRIEVSCCDALERGMEKPEW